MATKKGSKAKPSEPEDPEKKIAVNIAVQTSFGGEHSSSSSTSR